MKVKVLKTFHDDKLNRRVQPGETITVTETVGADLGRLGLVEPVEASKSDEPQPAKGGKKNTSKSDGPQ